MSELLSDRLPQNENAEESVLGALLQSDVAVTKVIDGLEPEHFFRGRNALVYAAIQSLHGAGKPSDSISVVEELGRAGSLVDAGGAERVHELASLMPSTANALHHAEYVRNDWAKREVVKVMQTALEDARNGLVADDVMNRLERATLDLRQRVQQKHDTVVPIDDALKWFFDKVKNPIPEGTGIQPPFQFLDPLQGSRMYVLGGYQKDGKSSVAMQFLKAAANAGAKVGFLTLEMSWRDLTDRLIATYGVPYRQVQSGQIEGEKLDIARAAAREIKDWTVDLIDDEQIDPVKVRRYQRLRKYDFVIVDHLHRMEFGDRRDFERKVQAMNNITREFEVPLLLLAQLKRSDNFQNPFPEPTMSSVRESGMVEAEAATVWFIWRKRDKEGYKTTESKYIIAADRFGPDGFARALDFHPRTVSFEWTGN